MMKNNSKKQMMPDFIIFGTGNYNSLGVLHALSSEKKEAFVLCIGKSRDWKSGNIIGKSKFAKNIKQIENADEGVEWLIKNKNLFIKNTIIYPTGDVEEMALDNASDKLFDHYLFPGCRVMGEVSKLMDKHIQTDHAQKAGIRILKSQYSNSTDFSYSKIEYPCMIKPLNSTAGSKGDMRICNNETEVREALKNGKHTQDFILQKYILNEADYLFLGVTLPNGEVMIPALVKKPGVSPTGEYTHAIITTDIDTHLPEKEDVIRFVKSLNYIGPFSIEFGHENGKNYFFEINLRNDGTSHYPLQARVNIPLIYYNSLRKRPIYTNWNITEYEMIDEVGDLRRVLNRELTPFKWFKNYFTAGTFKYYHPSDKKLICILMTMFFYRSFSKITRMLTK